MKLGDEVTAKIVDFNEADKKISLSIKAMLEPDAPADASDESADKQNAEITAYNYGNA